MRSRLHVSPTAHDRVYDLQRTLTMSAVQTIAHFVKQSCLYGLLDEQMHAIQSTCGLP